MPRTRIQVEPKLRPELTSIVAKVRLPEYLGQPAVQEQDVRGGAVSLVKGQPRDVRADGESAAARGAGER